MFKYTIAYKETGEVLSEDWYLSQNGEDVIRLDTDYGGNNIIQSYPIEEVVIKFTISND